MLHKLKPLPRALVIIALIAPLGAWLFFKSSAPAAEEPTPIEAVQVTPAPEAATPPAQQPTPAPQPAPIVAAEQPTQPLIQAAPDAGLSAVLEAGKK